MYKNLIQQYGTKQEDEINELDIKKNFPEYANKVGPTLLYIKKDKPVQKTNNKKFGNGSIAQRLIGAVWPMKILMKLKKKQSFSTKISGESKKLI